MVDVRAFQNIKSPPLYWTTQAASTDPISLPRTNHSEKSSQTRVSRHSRALLTETTTAMEPRVTRRHFPEVTENGRPADRGAGDTISYTQKRSFSCMDIMCCTCRTSENIEIIAH